MNQVSEKLAYSLEQLKLLQDSGIIAVQSKMLWCLSPEQSIQIHIGDKTVPPQLLVRSPKGRNKPTTLLHNTSVFDIRSAMPEQAQLTVVDGLRVYSLAASLVHCAKATFAQKPIQMRTLLSMVTDASEVLSVLLDGGHVASAGRLAGAFRNIGRGLIADNIIKGMDAADYKVKEIDPFEDETQII